MCVQCSFLQFVAFFRYAEPFRIMSQRTLHPPELQRYYYLLTYEQWQVYLRIGQSRNHIRPGRTRVQRRYDPVPTHWIISAQAHQPPVIIMG